MFKSIAISSVLFLFPLMTLAQTGPATNFGSIGNVIRNVVAIINGVLVPAIFALAFIVFIWGMFKYFILGGADEETRDKGKQLTIYGIIGFVLMLSLWGLVNVVASGLGFTGAQTPTTPTTRIPG